MSYNLKNTADPAAPLLDRTREVVEGSEGFGLPLRVRQIPSVGDGLWFVFCEGRESFFVKEVTDAGRESTFDEGLVDDPGDLVGILDD